MTMLEKILTKHPVRHSREQKAAFRAWVLEQAQAMGYSARVEENGRLTKHQNLVIGNPETAVVTLLAHYDTPARHLLPSLVMPRSTMVFYAWQLLVVLLLFAASMAITLLLGMALPVGEYALFVLVGCYMGLLMLMNYGPANRHNANSSSGVAAVLETMAAIPQDKRGKIAFLLVDHGETGRQGASAYARTHLKVQSVRTVVSLNCVGVGEEFLVLPRKLARRRPEYMRLCTALQEDAERCVHVLEGGLTTYASDHDSFECGVAVMACKRSPGVGWYIPHLNTPKDTQCSQDNLTFLAQRFAALTEML